MIIEDKNSSIDKSSLHILAAGRDVVVSTKDLTEKFEDFLNLLSKVDLSENEKQFFYYKFTSAIILGQDGTTSPHLKGKQLFNPKKEVIAFKESIGLKLIKVIIGLLLITLGFGLIIIPAPSPSFEIATLFYFNPQDGVTLMDLIALLLIFWGIYISIRTATK